MEQEYSYNILVQAQFHPAFRKSRSRAEAFALLFHHRWVVPVLAETFRTTDAAGGARSAALRARLAVSRPSLDRTLEALVEKLGLLRRNPGYGHPLRPEFLLTARGGRIAGWCGLWTAVVEKTGAGDTGSRKWSAAAIDAIARAGGTARFSDLEAALGPATPRAIAQTLRGLAAAEVLVRRVDAGWPPATSYALTPAGRRLAAVAARLPAPSTWRPRRSA